MNFRLPGSVIKGGLGLSAAGVLAMTALIKPWEGVRYEPYYDVGGILTVCYGHTGPDVIEGRIYTKEECEALLVADIAKHEKAVDRALKVSVPEETRAAFISFAYNVGPEAFRKSTLVKLANAGDIRGACEQLSRWVFVKGNIIKGLVNRRISERGMCLRGIYPELKKGWRGLINV